MATVQSKSMTVNLIAPCGINCGVCRAHLRAKNTCPGCRAEDADKPKTRVICKIKTCETFVKSKLDYCFECDQFPCAVLLHLNKRYRTKYSTSPVANLLAIHKRGMSKLLRNEAKKWTCRQCSGLLCMHDPFCPACGHAWHGDVAST